MMAPVASAEDKILFTEPFVDKLADGWTWLREDASARRLDNGTLVLPDCALRGGLWLKENGGGNLPLRTPPGVKAGKLAVEVLVEIGPTGGYENAAGLIWYYDDDNYIYLGEGGKVGNATWSCKLVQGSRRKAQDRLSTKHTAARQEALGEDGTRGRQAFRPLSGIRRG